MWDFVIIRKGLMMFCMWIEDNIQSSVDKNIIAMVTGKVKTMKTEHNYRNLVITHEVLIFQLMKLGM